MAGDLKRAAGDLPEDKALSGPLRRVAIGVPFRATCKGFYRVPFRVLIRVTTSVTCKGTYNCQLLWSKDHCGGGGVAISSNKLL